MRLVWRRLSSSGESHQTSACSEAARVKRGVGSAYRPAAARSSGSFRRCGHAPRSEWIVGVGHVDWGLEAQKKASAEDARRFEGVSMPI